MPQPGFWRSSLVCLALLGACLVGCNASALQARDRPHALARESPGQRVLGDEVYQARVSRVVDGDTLWVKPLAGGPYRKLRLDGLDAPESCQPGGPESREALRARVLNEVVTVRVRAFDDYGRALAKVEFRGTDVGASLVLAGWAWTYRWRSQDGLYPAEESRAREARKGLFADGAAEAPWAFRRRNGPCPWP